MRIISGKYKGKKIIGYDMNGTRPTMDRVKESMFALIQNYLKEATILDLFAGSGSLGLEALSNNSLKCYFIDNSSEAINTLKLNTKDIPNCYILNKDCFEALVYFKEQQIKFDVILLDPPYHKNLMNDVINKIEQYDLLNENGIIVCEYEEGTIKCNYKLLKEKKYGKKNVSIYKRLQ